MNKEIAGVLVGGAALSVAVFDETEHSKAGDCVVYMHVRNRSGTAEVRGYVSPAELLEIGNALIDAALTAERVKKTGVL